MSSIDDILGQIVGQEIEGGCDDCDAFRKAEQQMAGFWIIRVFHDDWCPTLARYEAKP